MKTNQKYTQEEMYIAIELWQESNQSQSKFCKHEGIPHHIFLYWLRKYRKQKNTASQQTFIPVKVAQCNASIPNITGIITIDYPNGVQVHCPAQMSIEQLKSLIKL
jgi:hypothetical protein